MPRLQGLLRLGLTALLGCLSVFQPNTGLFSQSLPAIELNTVISGLNDPVDLAHAGDGSGRLFIVEQAGRILVYKNGSLLPAPFLDIRNQVTSGGEMGLLGLAFHPDYGSNRRFFVNYTARRPNRQTVIAEYQTSSANPDVAGTSERVLLTIDQFASNHNGGQIKFGPDGYLYIGMGDGGGGGDPQQAGQDGSSLLAKMLRIDVDQGIPYGIAADNPFVGTPTRDEIWALGLRNPWRFSFDRANGRIFTGDVGQNSREEVDIIERGGNYGWSIMEGRLCFSPSSGCNTDGLILPINDYGRSLGVSVTGGYVYRGQQFPELLGIYIFGDFGSSRIWGLTETNRGTWNRTEMLRVNFPPSAFGEDEEGELYVLDYGGRVLQLRVSNPQGPDSYSTLIPSSVRSDRWTSQLTLINRESGSNELRIRGRRLDGSIAAERSLTLAREALFRSSDILDYLNLPVGSFGPLSIESLSNQRFSVVSEVRSSSGTAGFFSGQFHKGASTERYIIEVEDTGEPGEPQTHRTNLGINNLGPSIATVAVSLINGSGATLANQAFQVNPQGMLQLDGIIRYLMGTNSATGLSGYLRLNSDQPIHAWASKIDNGTEDPSLESSIGENAEDSSNRLLLPSVSGTDSFKSVLVIMNRENDPIDVTLTARNSSGTVSRTLVQAIPAGGLFRSLDILSDLQAPANSFGPLTLEAGNGRLMSAVSEVRSANSTSGFFPAVSIASATLRRLVPEVVDTGDKGAVGSFRTNLGINNLGPITASVTVEFVGASGASLGSLLTSVPPQGLTQMNNVVRVILGSGQSTGLAGYVRLVSDQPIHAWASKINNGTDDPSIVMGTPY